MRGKYNIQDDELFQALKVISEALQNTKYFIFGGVGAQVHVASLETDNGRKDVKTVDDSRLRRTGDIDMYIADENAVVLFNELAAMYPDMRVVNIPNAVKIGPVQVNYVTSPQELKGFESTALDMLAKRSTKTIRKGNCEIEVDLESMEHLIAAKLSGNRVQAKDIHDVSILVLGSQKAGLDVNYQTVRELLKESAGEDRYHILEQILNQED
jgi:hypothetical protein